MVLFGTVGFVLRPFEQLLLSIFISFLCMPLLKSYLLGNFPLFVQSFDLFILLYEDFALKLLLFLLLFLSHLLFLAKFFFLKGFPVLLKSFHVGLFLNLLLNILSLGLLKLSDSHLNLFLCHPSLLLYGFIDFFLQLSLLLLFLSLELLAQLLVLLAEFFNLQLLLVQNLVYLLFGLRLRYHITDDGVMRVVTLEMVVDVLLLDLGEELVFNKLAKVGVLRRVEDVDDDDENASILRFLAYS